MPDKNFDRDMPHADITDLNRQSENGQGSIQWTFTTDHTVKEVLGKGFFHSGGRSGLQRLDFIEAWTEFRTISPVLIRLAVTKAVHGMPVEVVALGEPMGIATPEIPWWDILDTHRKANMAEINRAFDVQMGKVGKTKAAKNRLAQARDTALIQNADQG